MVKVVVALLLVLPAWLFVGAFAWTPSSRRDFVANVMVQASCSIGTVLISSRSDPAFASLLDDYGKDPKDFSVKQSSAAGSTASTVTILQNNKDHQSVIEPNLRSNYYYPTNKSRYLPRIQKCSQAIPTAFESLQRQDWDGLQTFATGIADDIVLPLKLYTSSLTGGGTNVKVSYVKDMNKLAEKYKVFQKKLVAAVDQHDMEATTQAMNGLSKALQTYRAVGHLEDEDGNIPSIDEIRRGLSMGKFYD